MRPCAAGDTMEAQGDGWRRMEVHTRAYFAEPAPEQKTRPAGARPCAEVDTLSLASLSRTLTLSSLSHSHTLFTLSHSLSLSHSLARLTLCTPSHYHALTLSRTLTTLTALTALTTLTTLTTLSTLQPSPPCLNSISQVDRDAMACVKFLAAMGSGAAVTEAQSGGCVLTAGLLTYKSRSHPPGRDRRTLLASARHRTSLTSRDEGSKLHVTTRRGVLEQHQ